MINWSEVAPALQTLLSGLATAAAQDPAYAGRWADRKAEYIHPAVQKELILRVTRVTEFQTDRVYTPVTVTPDEGDPYTVLQEHIVGMREFALEVRVESHDHSEQLSRWSWSMLERIRSGLFFQRSIDALLEVNVGLVSIGDARDVSFTFDKRRINAAMFEATFNAAFDLADPVSTNWFERVELTSQIKNPAGALLSSPPNVTALAVPEHEPEEDEEEEP